MDVAVRPCSVTLRAVGGNSVFTLAVPAIVFRAGRITYLMGHNGSGKSVFLRLLTGELRAAGGHVIDAAVERSAAVVRQDATQSLALDLTVRENLLIRMPTATFRDFLMPAIRYAETVSHLLDDHAELRNKADDLALHLSGGQRQTLAFLAAIVRGTKLLLLDEFLAATDLRTGAALQRMVRSYVDSNQACAVIVSHDVSSALAHADRVLLMREGRFVADLATGEAGWNREHIAQLITK